MNQIQHEQYTGKGGIYQQLTLPISENILIDEHEPVYAANAQLEELDYTKLYQAYSSRGRKSAAEPRIMFKLLVYGGKGNLTRKKLRELADKQLPPNAEFVHGVGKRKSEWQKRYEKRPELPALLDAGKDQHFNRTLSPLPRL